jgi:hypothetical protein
MVPEIGAAIENGNVTAANGKLMVCRNVAPMVGEGDGLGALAASADESTVIHAASLCDAVANTVVGRQATRSASSRRLIAAGPRGWLYGEVRSRIGTSTAKGTGYTPCSLVTQLRAYNQQ